jgi:OTU domain-containing protein 6
MPDEDPSDIESLQNRPRDVLLAQHASESSEFAKRAERMKTSVPRKDRVGRARVAEELAELEKAMRMRQKQELSEAGIEIEPFSDAVGTVAQNGDTPLSLNSLFIGEGGVAPIGPVETGNIAAKPKESKASRRRRQRAEEDAATESRIAAEKAGMGPSERAIESKALLDRLAIYDIPPDGHCLYAAVAHQLQVNNLKQDDGSRVFDVLGLRSIAADHMLRHKDEYIPFLETVSFDDAKFVSYCEQVRSEAVWGGQVELRALAEALEVPIEIYGTAMPVLVMGDVEDRDQSKAKLRLSFHRKYYELGDHYNSIVSTRGPIT